MHQNLDYVQKKNCGVTDILFLVSFAQVFADLEELELKLDTEMVNIVAETYEKLGMSDKAERVRLKYPPSAYRWRSIDGRTKRIPIRQPFIVSKFNPSTQGNVVDFINYYFHSVCAYM